MIIDDVMISISAGNGGRGSVAFQKNKQSLGPTGGSGGTGGDIYFEGVSDLSALNQFRYKKELAAQDGMDGRSQFRDGHTGKDLVLLLPVGTVIHNKETGDTQELTKVGERILMARGGKGGKGNFLFRSSRNTTPKQFQHGLPGKQFMLRLELKMIADIGLIGYPNVGKSSFLNEFTNAKSKVANYKFTTLEPNLGVYFDLILADIPGLIEGASSGKGLGIKFLRHIERTRVLFHFISAESTHPVKDYRAIRKELTKHNKEIAEKPEYIFISKSDEASQEDVKKKVDAIKKIKSSQKKSPIKMVIPFSLFDEKSIEKAKKILEKVMLDRRA